MQFGSALSSIQKSFPNEDSERAGGEFVRYGSTNRSDDEIYKMLNVTQVINCCLCYLFLFCG